MRSDTDHDGKPDITMWDTDHDGYYDTAQTDSDGDGRGDRTFSVHIADTHMPEDTSSDSYSGYSSQGGHSGQDGYSDHDAYGADSHTSGSYDHHGA
jgi:hypothetical protein